MLFRFPSQAIYPRLRRTIIFDNDTEFAEHPRPDRAPPHANLLLRSLQPWQKGAVENTIGRLRRFLPRKTNLNTLDDKALYACIAAYNNTPRKCLRFKTPAEVPNAQLLCFKLESTPSLGLGMMEWTAPTRHRCATLVLGKQQPVKGGRPWKKLA